MAQHADDGDHWTFVYIHLHPFRRHLLQLSQPGYCCLHSGREDPLPLTGWHGQHTMRNPTDTDTTITMSYEGYEAHCWQRLECVRDSFGHSCQYLLFHCDEPWAYMFFIGAKTAEETVRMVQELRTSCLLFERAPTDNVDQHE